LNYTPTKREIFYKTTSLLYVKCVFYSLGNISLVPIALFVI